MLTNRRIEGVMEFAEPMLQDFSKADQDGKRDAAQDQGVDELLQIDGSRRFFFRVNENMSLVADGKISFAPARYIEELGGIY